MANARATHSVPGADARAELARAGLRCTRERVLTLTTLARVATPRTVEELSALLGGSVHRVTLYRTLERLVGGGVVERVLFPDGLLRYEYVSTHHHHVTCTRCGRHVPITFSHARMNDTALRVAPDFATVEGHTLEFYGTCRVCERAAGGMSGYATR